MTIKPVSITRNITDNSRGFLAKINWENETLVEIIINESTKGHQATYYEHESGDLLLICIGHLYSINAKSFSINESLELLAKIYKSDDLDTLNSAIGGGIFTLLIIDKLLNKIIALTDFLACMPLFHQEINNGYLLGTNQFDFPESDNPSLIACGEYLSYGYLPFHESLFAKVHRIGPGQIIKINCADSGIVIVSEKKYPKYPPQEKRIANEDEAIMQLDTLLSKFFSRLGNEPIAAGLSGGYDSRLIAAYCRKKAIHLVTYDNPKTKEACYARQVADILGLQTEVFNIPGDAPSRFSDDFFYGMGTIDSLESSHVFGNLNILIKDKPSYIIDGHIGDVVFGGGFYSKLKSDSEPLWKYLIGIDKYQSAKKENVVYLKKLSSGYGRKIDGLKKELANQVDEYGNKVLFSLIENLKENCHSHSDIVEILLQVFRGAALASGGPVTFLRRTPTLCPFYDKEIFFTCMSIDKSLRAGDRLYNAFYRHIFPELTDIPKENTRGTASQGVIFYRMTHLKNALLRKVVRYLPNMMQKGGGVGGDIDDFLDQYLNNETNVKFFKSILANTSISIKEIKSHLLDFTTIEDNKALYLRYISLAFLLKKQ
ncbi:asparagine synthase-related protein [Spirochaeta isovalerica]|uniref:asparagine synthase (glutamine-hydrolyzing) n=1 Tax=Spirochaeta isovalerica TaxID=150 RepID=A0A841R9X5_9SPIO|nr:asparagine synthase-related protein [Spirochaeta isovalerica]MBB6479252.1 asparagine synthetase B (glutamine-hydrolyzing) [Spirochaeta isovalerica]